MAQMRTTAVVGVFEDYGTALTVVQELEQSGFPRENVHVTSNLKTGAAGSGVQGSGQTGHVHDEGGGITGFFRRLFGSDVDEKETGSYDEAVRGGSAVVSVEADQNRLDKAVDIMNRNGAIDVDRRATSTSGREEVRGEQDQRSIPVVEEELQIGKRVIQRGGVRIYTSVIERPVEEQVTLLEEHVTVERHPVNRPVSAGEMPEVRDQTIEVTETAEEPVVSKRARVVEEVKVDKKSTQRTETVRDKVRKSEVKVENVGSQQGGASTSDIEEDFRKDFASRYAGSGTDYESVSPAYQYGYRMARDNRFQGKGWDDVESDLKTDYLRNNPNSTWDRIKGAIRYGWEKVTGKR